MKAGFERSGECGRRRLSCCWEAVVGAVTARRAKRSAAFVGDVEEREEAVVACMGAGGSISGGLGVVLTTGERRRLRRVAMDGGGLIPRRLVKTLDNALINRR